MLYGFKRGKDETVIGAADTVEELESWYQSVCDEGDAYTLEHRGTDFMEHLTEQDFKGYKHPAYVFKHTTHGQDKFIAEHGIEIMGSMRVRDRHLDMMSKMDDSLKSDFDLRDTRTIGEITGLETGHDPWDTRSEEEKEKAKEQEKRTDELRKRLGDHVTGQSFDPNPRAGQEDGIKITDIFKKGGKINVGGMKFGAGSGKTKTPELEKPTFEGQEVTDDMIEELMDGLRAGGYTDEDLQKLKDQFDLDDPQHRVFLAEVAAEEIKRQGVAEALKPVEGDKSHEEILQEVEGKLKNVDLSAEEHDALMESVKNKLEAPMPVGADFRFAINQRLTDEPAMRGEGTPIFNVEKNPNGPGEGQFGSGDAGLFLPKEEGFDMVSSGIFACEDGSDVATVRQRLLDKGFIEDASVLPQKHQRVRDPNKPLPSPEDFAKALGGDGTSTASVADSWGREKVGIESNTVEEDGVKPGLVGQKGAVLEITDGLEDIKFDDLPAEMKNAIGKDLQDLENAGKQLRMGPYNGMVSSGSLIPFPFSPDYGIRDDLCGNMRDHGGVEMHGSGVRMMNKASKAYAGVVVYEGKKDVLILTV